MNRHAFGAMAVGLSADEHAVVIVSSDTTRLLPDDNILLALT